MTEWAEKKERLRQRFRKRTRHKIVKRDNHKCRVCGSGEDLTVHHVHSISSCIKQDKRYLIKDEGNLVTLCQKCHEKAPNGDDYYGWESKKVSMASLEKVLDESLTKNDEGDEL